jgi:hypothetical protein
LETIPKDKKFWTKWVVMPYLTFVTVSKDLLSTFRLWFCPAFYDTHEHIYLVVSAVTSRPINLLATNKACAFFTVHVLSPSKSTQTQPTKIWCVPFSVLEPS